MGSLTSIICIDSDEFNNSQFEKNVTQVVREIESLTDSIVDFNFKDVHFRNIKPKLNFSLLKNQELFMPTIFKIIKKQLISLLEEVYEQKHAIKQKQELKIHFDPWDYYLVYDSDLFMKILLSNKYYQPTEQLILTQFILQCVEQDEIAYFKQTPDQIAASILKLAKELDEFEEKSLVDFIDEKLLLNGDDENIIQLVLENINRFYELAMMHFKMNDELRSTKKDYFGDN